MALTRFNPVVSSGANVYARETRASAVQAALLNQDRRSAEYTNLLNVWPQIRSYENDPVGLSLPFVWGETNFNRGQRLGFATVINNSIPAFVLSAGNYGYTLGAFADNAHRAFLEVYTVSGMTITLVQTIFSDLNAGTFDPNVLEIPPLQLAICSLFVGLVHTECECD